MIQTLTISEVIIHYQYVKMSSIVESNNLSLVLICCQQFRGRIEDSRSFFLRYLIELFLFVFAAPVKVFRKFLCRVGPSCVLSTATESVAVIRTRRLTWDYTCCHQPSCRVDYLLSIQCAIEWVQQLTPGCCFHQRQLWNSCTLRKGLLLAD